MENTNRCVIDSKGYYVEYVNTYIDDKGERTAEFYEMKKGEKLIEADPPYWTFGSDEKAKWLGDKWDSEPPPPPVPTPPEQRRQAYASDKLVKWQGEEMTVDGANLVWLHYAAEGNDMTALEKEIHTAKEKIRKKYPDK